MSQRGDIPINDVSSNVEEDMNDQHLSRSTSDSRPANLTNATQSDLLLSLLDLWPFLPFLRIEYNAAQIPTLIFDPHYVASTQGEIFAN